MLLPAVISAIGLLSTAVEAAPKGTDFKKVRSETAAPLDVHSPSNGYFPGPNVYNLTNTSMSTISHHSTETIILYDDPVATVECGTASVLILTTTIDVTVFVTATANLTHTEEPCDDDDDDDTATAHRTDDYAHLLSASTDCDGEDSPGYAGPKTTTVVEESHSTKTEPCSEDELYPVNSNNGLHPYSTRTVRPEPYNTDMDTIEPYMDHHLPYPVKETGHAPHYTDVSPWSTTLGAQARPSDYDAVSASPTQQPEAVYTLPFGGSNNTYLKPSESLKPYGPSKPYDDGISSTTPASDSAATYTLPFASSNATYAAPSESTEAYVDQPSYATPSSHSAVAYTLPFGGSDTAYAEPTETYALPKPYVDQPSYGAPSSHSAAVYTLSSGGSDTAYAEPTETYAVPEPYAEPSFETPSSHSAAAYALPSGGSNDTSAAPSETSEPYASPEPYVEPLSVTSTSDSPAIEYTPIPVASSSISTSALSSMEPAYDVPIPGATVESLPYYPIAPSSSSSNPGATPVSSSSSDEPWYSDMPSYYYY
ncbi:hypothetical protein EDB81DRAFT_180983 [Dactylonectria macrodidyma]|uniref:Uncharacterized protein n=1 Tax=Dactylonectria macrodidyma TaxID=307937 RepID=A0A9P9JPK7_9HYPO|nr:hypothetical protein EDB81DRAFT_180983 [Dactylonectria macrodidyma]